MVDAHLNLARKWRSRQFDSMIGQDLTIRMLKNSLYKGLFVPVYLFSGTRGCGKTSAARIFAAAINCERLPDFQRSPKEYVVPCQECASCREMVAGTHPDFIEIDAASHTGVDHVRQIIEASTLLPLMGRKKVYLIDEAHMLSRAAFNALLKVLEEPSPSVLFILATTDAPKIIETVRSRCFQLFFSAIDGKTLVAHLASVCEAEGISAEMDALALIAQESEGSVRDALNVLEKLRFSPEKITKKAIYGLLGKLSDEQIFALFDSIVNGGHAQILNRLAEYQQYQYDAEQLFFSLIEVARAALWLKYGVAPVVFHGDRAELERIISHVPVGRIRTVLERLCAHETVLHRTTKKQVMLETILLSGADESLESVVTAGSSPGVQRSVSPRLEKGIVPHVAQERFAIEATAVPSVHETRDVVPGGSTLVLEKEDDHKKQFLKELLSLKDPLLSSIFERGVFVVEATGVRITLSSQYSFFKDVLDERASLWRPVGGRIFGTTVPIHIAFSDSVPVEPIARPTANAVSLDEKRGHGSPEKEQGRPAFVMPGSGGRSRFASQKRPVASKMATLDVSDKEKWGRVHEVLEAFPGTVHELTEGMTDE